MGVSLSAAEVNLLKNPGFEQDKGGDKVPDDWKAIESHRLSGKNPAILQRDSEVFHSGKHSVRIEAEKSSRACWQQKVTLEGPGKYRIGYWVKTESLEGKPPMGKGFVGAVMLKESGKYIGYFWLKNSVGTNDWRKHTQDFELSEGTHTIEVFLTLDHALGKLWFDDVEIVATKTIGEEARESTKETSTLTVTPTSENICQNPSAEQLVSGRPVGFGAYDWAGCFEWGTSSDAHTGKASLYYKIIKLHEKYGMPSAAVIGNSDCFDGANSFVTGEQGGKVHCEFFAKGDIPRIEVWLFGWASKVAHRDHRFANASVKVGEFSSTAQWKKYSFDFNLPAPTLRFVMKLMPVGGVKPGQQLFLDDVIINGPGAKPAPRISHE